MSVEDFITSLRSKTSFPGSTYADRLQSACKASQAVFLITSSLPDPSPSSKSATIDGQDCSAIIDTLAIATCARGLSQVTDDFGFSKTVDRDKAIDRGKAEITSLIPYMVADDIDSHLSSSKFPPLTKLKDDAVFIKRYNEELKKPSFIKTVKDHDRAASTNTYGMNLMFVYQFLNNGGKYAMIQSLNENIDVSGVISLAQSWFEAVTVDKVNDITDAAEALLWTSCCLSSVYAKNGYPDEPLVGAAATLADVVAKSAFPAFGSIPGLNEAITSLVPGAVSQYNSLSSYMWGIWEGRNDAYIQAMLSAANITNVTTETHDDPRGYCTEWGAPCTTINFPYTITHTRFGDSLSSWISKERSQGTLCFSGDPPNSDQRTKTTSDRVGGSYGCFAPGTLVLTESGSKPIELLRENDRVLTRSPECSTGVCSDETVAISTRSSGDSVLLYGFNGDEPFFTAEHVFYTSTGLRALNPVLAMKENPWLVVGRLQIGHKLLHTEKAGDQYRFVTINSIHHQRARCEYVHGVHLREGLRSYHANGYLVHLNYPEITIKSLAKDILALPPQQQVDVLKSAKELSPLFHRFGGATLITALARQAFFCSRRETTKKCRPRTHVDLRHMNRKWHVYRVDHLGQRQNDALHLKCLSLTDGILSIDGEYCERAMITAKTLHWTRQLLGSANTSRWEHGVCFLGEHGVAGQGYLFVSNDSDPKETPSVKDRVRFVAAMPRRDHTVANTTAGVNAPATMTATAAVNVAALQTGLSALSAADNLGDDDDETFALMYGPATQDARLFDAVLTSTPASTGGIVLPDVQIPMLDRLQDLLQSKLKEHLKLHNDATLVRLYEVSSTLDDTQNTLTTVTMLYPDMVWKACDDAANAEPSKGYKDLTFQSLGFSEALPLLFAKFSFGYNFDGSAVKGTVVHYDPVKPGTYGEEFPLAGTLKENATFNHASRLAVTEASHTSFVRSVEPTSISTMAERQPHVSHAQPAAASISMASNDTCAPMSAQSLAELAPWDDAEVHAQSQALLYRTMLYHIDDNDREMFFQEAKPDNLDPQLTSGLSDDVKTWIKATYGPAYICNRLEGVDDSSKNKWRRHFTPDEQKRLRWFWNGKGAKSIYCAPAYNALNEVTAAVAVRNLHPCLNHYIDDKSPDNEGNIGGKRWSNALFRSMSTAHSVKHLTDNFRLGVGSSLLSKHCNGKLFIDRTLLSQGFPLANYWMLIVMHALDADTANSNALAGKVRRKLETDTSNLQPNTADDSKETQENEFMWLRDTMRQLILAVLNNDPKVNAAIRESLMKDISTLMEEWAINQSQGNDQKTEQILNNSTQMVNQLAALLKSMRLANTNKLWTGLKGWAKATKAGSYVAAAASNKKVGIAFKGLAILTGVANFLRSAVGAYRNWSKLSTDQRAALVLDTVAVVCQTAGGLFDLWEMIKKPSSGAVESEVREQTAASILDDAQRTSAVQANEDQVDHRPDAEKTEDIGVQTAEDMNKSKENPNLEPDPMQETSTNEAARLTKLKKEFNSVGNWIKGALIIIGAAVTIVMIVQVAKSWKDLKLVDKILDVAQIIQQGLAVIVDAAGLVTEGLFAFGQIAASTLAIVSTCLAWAGAILAVIGLALMIAMMIWDATKEPPLSPVEKWIEDHGEPFLKDLDAPPPQLLSYTCPTDFSEGDVLTFTAKNDTKEDITVSQISVFFQTGDDSSTLTTQDSYVPYTDNTKPFTPGMVRCQPADPYVVVATPSSSQKNIQNKQLIREQVLVSGLHDETKNPGMKVTIKAGQELKIQVFGTKSSSGPSTVEIEEQTTDSVPVSSFFTINKK